MVLSLKERRNSMSNLPPLSTRRESFADGLTIRVDEGGSGRPILVLHGGGGPQTVAGIASGLSKARVLVPTHPGFAGEPRPGVGDAPSNHLLRNRGTTPRVNEIALNLAGFAAKKIPSDVSRW